MLVILGSLFNISLFSQFSFHSKSFCFIFSCCILADVIRNGMKRMCTFWCAVRIEKREGLCITFQLAILHSYDGRTFVMKFRIITYIASYSQQAKPITVASALCWCVTAFICIYIHIYICVYLIMRAHSKGRRETGGECKVA